MSFSPRLICLSSLFLLGAAYPSSTLESGGKTWTYYSVVPPGLEKPPLVLLFHGLGSSGDRILEQSQWAEKAARERIVVVAPDGQPPRPTEPIDPIGNPRRWNNDLEFTQALLTRALVDFRCDSRRVYLVGHSNGAKFCYQLAAAYPRQWAAMAIVSGLTPPDLPPQVNPVVPTYAFHGEEDAIIPLDGGAVDSPWGTREMAPVPAMLGQWAHCLGYADEPTRIGEDDLQFTDRYGPEFLVTYLRGHGHSYPSPATVIRDPRLGPIRYEVPVNDMIWDFFSRHPAPPRWFQANESRRR